MSDYYLCNQLINHLLNASDPISKRDLATFLGVSAKVVKRLKESINEDGMIITEYNGVGGGYFIENKSLYRREPLNAKDQQSLLNIKSILEKDKSIINQLEFIKTLEKVANNRESSTDIISSVVNGFPLAMPREKLTKYYDQLLFAIENTRKISIEYHKPNSNKNEFYIVHPFELLKNNNAWYFNSKKDDDTTQTRQFKLNRIVELRVLDQKYFKTKDYTSKGSTLKSIKIKLRIKNSSFIDEIIIGKNPKIEYIGSNTLILETELEGEYITKGFILSLGSNCEVIEPESLRKEIMEELQKTVDLYNL